MKDCAMKYQYESNSSSSRIPTQYLVISAQLFKTNDVVS